MKYIITEEDLKKRSHGISFDFVNADFLHFIQKEKELNNPFLSDHNIKKLENDTLKDIKSNIYTFGTLGIVSFSYGLYVFFTFAPRVAINLYTQFPFIENGSIPIVIGLSLIVGCAYSYVKRRDILVTKVKSKVIEHLKKIQREKSSLTDNKKRNTNLQPKRKRKKKR
ncbi:hypothetical protein SAMN04487910_0639 [Aquimarina amphilecti]|uniref:Uncharacterized protein n=1 Tax=Aquimarina amphilecti TaxID=1038014 RepID=A0A1H7HF46_AQUAM|nr:hypothetical protein [Aquimarina amphilecti]SEK48818.1 hypothetical protein SAMN04487910_0639 [Aquimarina amphilecti]